MLKLIELGWFCWSVTCRLGSPHSFHGQSVFCPPCLWHSCTVHCTVHSSLHCTVHFTVHCTVHYTVHFTVNYIFQLINIEQFTNNLQLNCISIVLYLALFSIKIEKQTTITVMFLSNKTLDAQLFCCLALWCFREQAEVIRATTFQ